MVAVKGNQVSLNFPVEREVLFALRKDENIFLDDMKKILALEYFRSQQLSLGLAAKLAGMSKDDFIQYLGANQVDIFQYSDNEFDDELEFLSGVGK